MSDQKSIKKNSKGKDLPRYKAIVGYEKAFKKEYARTLGSLIVELLTHVSK